jgi:hypothetical protein
MENKDSGKSKNNSPISEEIEKFIKENEIKSGVIKKMLKKLQENPKSK